MRLAPLLLVRTAVFSLLAVPAIPAPARAQAAAGNEEIHIVLTGDSIVNRRLSVYTDPDNTDLFRTIQHGDVSFTSFETLAHHYAYPGASESDG